MIKSPLISSLLVLAGTALAMADAPTSASITIHPDAPALKASPNLYGIFIEDWCHQVEGGIYGEMVRNRSFDDTKSAKEVLVMGFAMNLPEAGKTEAAKEVEVPGWKLVTAKPGAAQWAIDGTHPLNENRPHSLRLDVADPSPQTGIYNEGWCKNITGISVTQGSDYLFSCYARAETTGAGLTVSLQTPEGKSLSTQAISGLTGEWKKYELTLTPSESLAGARLFISPTAAGAYTLNMVSLFPKETWKNRPNGLRKDLMEMLEKMKPSFVRFPGGCFVEGLGLANSWQWKKTIGPVEQRPGHWNIWGWHTTDGMGYFEYLQMCEDLGAAPLLVVNDGISHDANKPYDTIYEYVPMEKMDEVVQDALDAIEYANGPVDSTWGAKRAAAGHPQPFNLKFIEVGNENFGPEYARRYALFQDAIKAKHPEITVIMDTYGPANYPKNRIPDMRDIHRFATPYQFAIDYDQFDGYDRKGPKVYFGEWCVDLELPGKDSLFSGLHEAAFLTGLEKNSDHVLMTSYAPLMNNMGWHDIGRKPNMVNFDLNRVYGAPIYWIQKMYAEHRIDTLLGFTAASPELHPTRSVPIGVGTLETEAEFKDIVVTGPKGVLFDGKTAPRDAWTIKPEEGSRAVNSIKGVLFQGVTGEQSEMTRQPFTGDFTLTLKAQKLGGKHGFRVYFAERDYWQIGGDGNKSAKIMGDRFFIRDNFTSHDIVDFTLQEKRWYDLRVEVHGDEVSCFIDGKLVNRTSYKPLQSLYVSAGSNDSTDEIILKVVNISPEVQRTQIQIPGTSLAPVGTATTITSDDPLDKNSLDVPDKIVPKTSPVRNVSADFTYDFPASSVTVLQLRKAGASK